ncbi:MAG: nucleotidyltransferase family protein [Chromatiales bacterium]
MGITGILLAAGASTRFGSTKLLHPLADGIPIGIASAQNLLHALPESIAVVRPQDQALIDAYEALGLKVVINTQAELGMATSIAVGVQAASQSDGWLIALADMPWVQPTTIELMKEELLAGASIAAPVYRGQRGNPVGFSARWRDELLALQGDTGARELLRQYGHEISLLDTNDRGVMIDVDHPNDLGQISTT